MESLAEFYYDQLINSDNKVSVLVTFFSVLFNPPAIGGLDYARFNRLVKIYGYNNIFYSLLDMAEVENVNLETYQRLLSYFAKRRLEQILVPIPTNMLDGRVKEVEKSLNRKRKPRIRQEPFKEDE